MEQNWTVADLPDELVIYNIAPYLSHDDLESLIATLPDERPRLAGELRRVLGNRPAEYTEIIKNAIVVQKETGSAVMKRLIDAIPHSGYSRECVATATVFFRDEMWKNPGENVLDHIPRVLRGSTKRYALDLLVMWNCLSGDVLYEQFDFLMKHIDRPRMRRSDRRRLTFEMITQRLIDVTFSLEEAVDYFCDDTTYLPPHGKPATIKINYDAAPVTGLDYLAIWNIDTTRFDEIVRTHSMSHKALAEFICMKNSAPMSEDLPKLTRETKSFLAQQACADGDYDSLRAKFIEAGVDAILAEVAVKWVNNTIRIGLEPHPNRELSIKACYFYHATRFDPDNEAYYRRLFFKSEADRIDDTPKMFEMLGRIAAAMYFAFKLHGSSLAYDSIFRHWYVFFNANNVTIRADNDVLPRSAAADVVNLMLYKPPEFSHLEHGIESHIIIGRLVQMRISIYDIVNAPEFMPSNKREYQRSLYLLEQLKIYWSDSARRDCGILQKLITFAESYLPLHIWDTGFIRELDLVRLWPKFTAEDFTGPERAEFRLFVKTVLAEDEMYGRYLVLLSLLDDCVRDLSSPSLLVVEDETHLWADALWPTKDRFFSKIDEWINTGVIPQEKAASAQQWCARQRQHDEEIREGLRAQRDEGIDDEFLPLF